MKNKIFRKAMSLIMAVLILAVACVPAFANGSESAERNIPHIYIHGFMASDIYADVDDLDNNELLWPPATDDILNAVKKALAPLAELIATKDWDKFGEKIVPIVDELFAPVCSGFDGEPGEGTGIRFEYPEEEEVKEKFEEDNSFNFYYDWRMDPVEVADQLNSFVDYILETTDSEQVTMHCHSLGGVITLSYLKLYGNEKVKSVAFDSTAIYGETYTGELLSGNAAISTDAIYYYLDFAFDYTDAEVLMDGIMKLLKDAGLMEAVANLGQKFIDNLFDDVAMSLLKVFANWPTIWAMVPDDMLAAAESYVFNDQYSKAGVDYSGLQAKVESYNTKVREGKTQTLQRVAETTNVYVISRYGYSSIPVTPSWYSLGDGVVDTKNNSFGATTAKYGETLTAADSPYISPDKTVDASTCVFPEQTWFVKNIKHSDVANCINIMVEKLFSYEGRATVDTFEEYPRFLEYNAKEGAVVPDGKIEPVESFWIIIADFFKKIFSFIFSIFG